MDKTRRKICQAGCAAAIVAAPGVTLAQADQGLNAAIENIRGRRSVRSFSPRPIPEKDLKTILECAMLAPSAINEQPWEFVVITDADILEKIPAINPYASFARTAPAAILVCLNKDKDKEGMGILDVAMSSENILLAAEALGLGAVFTGVYPLEDRMRKFAELVNLPQSVIPIGLIVMGYPTEDRKPTPDRYNQGAVHMQRWS